MPQGSIGGHPRCWIPLQAPADEVKEEGVVTALEGRLQLPGAGGTTWLATSRPPSVQDGGAVRKSGGGAVAGVA